MENFTVGSSIRLFWDLVDEEGEPINADDLTLKIQAGASGEIVDLTSDVVTVGEGQYHCDFDIEIATAPTDPYRYTWRSTGAVKAVTGGRFMSLAVAP